MLHIVSNSNVRHTETIAAHGVFLFLSALLWMFQCSLDNEDASFPEKTKGHMHTFPQCAYEKNPLWHRWRCQIHRRCPTLRPNKDIPSSENTALCCVVLKCLHQANTINSAEQCHALTLTIYLLKISTALTCVTIKRLTNDPPDSSAVKKSWLWHL